MIRFNIVQGDLTTSGGYVIGASLNAIIGNRMMAGEGDSVTCPKCGSVGRILCVGPRIPGIFDGVMEALSGDIVLCKCERKPVLLNSQTEMFQMAPAESHAAPSTAQSVASLVQFDTHFCVHHAVTGEPVESMAYVIQHAGETIAGQTGNDGKTALLTNSVASQGMLLKLVQTRIGVR
ncbi:PAAR domain-containing protein [Silvimonas amylolytica]|uniref:Bacteriophage gp29 protein n=1 Tax=Silvimonas amylolytica TaxID=449663 RepID=A0ABQ2PMS9_9NEIS|nr:PAAR domain-containing protein [Silvimonas amylolytica]GGP26711.1 bacteriophage gp29 protein [Silvimonas amylolytica]